MNRTSIRIPDWILEQYNLGELPDHDRRVIDELLITDKVLLARLEELRRSDRDILATYTPARFVRMVEQRALHQQSDRRKKMTAKLWRPSLEIVGLRGLLRIAVPVIATSLIILVLLPHNRRERQLPDNTAQITTVRTKGLEPQCNIYYSSASDLHLLGDSSTVDTGDTLQIAYVASKAQYGVMVSVDGRGMVTLHFPQQASLSTGLQQSGEEFICSYELDDAPGFERFYFVTSNTPIAVQDILMTVKLACSNPDSLTALKLPEGYKQSSIVLLKAKGPR